MMRAKADLKAPSNTIMILACVLLAGSVVGLIVPKPNAKDVQAKERTETKKLKTSAEVAKRDALLAKASVVSRTWVGEQSTIQAQLVNLTTSLAKKRGVEWLRLQPQKSVVGGALEQVPFLLVVEGPFPAVASLERDLEAPQNRLAISAFQVASSDSESNKVSASIGLVAHRVPADVVEEKGNAKRPQP